jgi:dTDP-4-amino-4,6-dideoxygalactose transaminase
MTKYSLAESSWDSEELEAIQRVINSKRFSMGPEVKQFEQDFAKFFGSKYAVMVNSGSSANLLAIASLFYTRENRLKKGDEVIVPAVSWSTTYYPLYQYGLKLKFVDIDKDTMNFDLVALEKAVTENTRAIFAVNLLGNSNDFDEINRIIDSRNIILLEDNCESMGATFKGQYTGTFGKMGTFSTFFSHHISTMEGGVVLTNDEELYHIMLSTRSHGWTRTLPKENLLTGTKSDYEFDESFKFILPGYNLRPVEMSGAIGIEQLKKLPKFIETRRKNAKLFVEYFKDHKYFEIQKEIGVSSWFGFTLIIKENAPFTRRQLVIHLENHNIDCRPVVAGNFAKNKVMDYFEYEIHGDLVNADTIDQYGFFVGNHHLDLADQVTWLKSKIEDFLNSIKD